MQGKSKIVVAEPLLSLTPYASNDQIGGALLLRYAMDDDRGDTGAILSVAVVDKASQNSAFDILFFKSLPVIASTDNEPLDISAAEMVDKYVGRVSVAAGDYEALANCSDATVLAVGLLVESIQTTDLYAVIHCKGTPTFTSTNDLTIKIGILQD